MSLHIALNTLGVCFKLFRRYHGKMRENLNKFISPLYYTLYSFVILRHIWDSLPYLASAHFARGGKFVWRGGKREKSNQKRGKPVQPHERTLRCATQLLERQKAFLLKCLHCLIAEENSCNHWMLRRVHQSVVAAWWLVGKARITWRGGIKYY